MAGKLNALLLEGVNPKAAEILQGVEGVALETSKDALDAQQLLAYAPELTLLGIRSRTRLDAGFFAAATKLRAVGCFCIGTNQVDLAAAARAGVVVFNAPYANTRSVAELVLAEIIMLMRRVPEVNAAAHRGVWMKSAQGCFEVRGKTLGIVGYGRIGSQLGLLAEAVGMQVRYYDVANKLPFGNARACASLGELLGCVDALSLHVPHNPQTRNLIDKPALAQLRPGALLINAARGDIVDIPAVVEALDSGRLAGVALDVYPEEPQNNQESFHSELQRFPQALLTPHIGGSTQEAQENIAVDAASKLRDYLLWGQTLAAVNFPEVALSPHRDACRLLHIHKNLPGVLGALNDIFSAAGVNICGQHLQTRGELGYAVTDVDSFDGMSCVDRELFTALGRVKHSIKVITLSPLA